MKQKKTPQHSKSEKPQAKNGTSFNESYMNMQQMEQVWISEEGIKRIAAELVRWANEDKDALKITQFFLSRGINTPSAYRWKEKYPFFADAWDEALLLLGNRREIGAIKKKYAESTVQKMQHYYDPAWAKGEERYAKLRDPNENLMNQQKIVILERYPETDVVPKKEKK